VSEFIDIFYIVEEDWIGGGFGGSMFTFDRTGSAGI